jgi:2-keto-4-pentenoate hydratase/2-oxohepta-3-ene-1,7-dioic acid hydratase in catechol pathway
MSSVTSDIDGAFLASNGVDRARAAVAAALPQPDADGVRIGAPVSRPGKIVCVGLNYRDHAAETGAAFPPLPVVFMKDPGTVAGPYDEVLSPRGSVKTDWEVEPAVVIGRRGRYLDGPEATRAVIAGYAVGHDGSEREFRLEYSSQWDLGKSCETFLEPGDVINTGTPAGVALGLAGTPYLRPGDTVELSVDGLGGQRQTFGQA